MSESASLSPSFAPRRTTYTGMFLVALATMLFELLLTRVFSVTMWYHFAFVAVSVAMFGMTVGAVVVFLRPDLFRPGDVERRAAQASLLCALAMPAAVLSHLATPFLPQWSVLGLYSVAFTYAAVALPLVLSGVVISLLLSRAPGHVGRLYAADLFGAAVGCAAFLRVLDVMDAPNAAVLAGFLVAAAALAFARGSRSRAATAVAVVLLAFLGAWSTWGTWRAWRGAPLVRLTHIKGGLAERPVFETWNSFSRVAVFGNPAVPSEVFGWGMSRAYDGPRAVPQLHVNIDGTAGTVITGFDGNLQSIAHLRHDVTNVAHWLRPGGTTFVVGVGGGRDVLSALAFGTRAVTGAEINGDLLALVNDRYGDFAGRLGQRADVRFVHDEARSWLRRSRERFDLIQVSLIDTWAATAAGAYVFTENSLYTLEAWRDFLEHLTPTGVLTVSRWYYGARPAEIYRLISLARASLAAVGVERPRDHLVLVRNPNPVHPDADAVGTLLVAREPFSAADLQRLDEIAAALRFEIVLDPRRAADPMLAALADVGAAHPDAAAYPLDISVPTDDRPFFFHVLRLRDALDGELARQGLTSFNTQAVFVLATLLAVTAVACLACIGLPLLWAAERTPLRGHGRLFVFFVSIGAGFMLVELSQIQRLSVFLGHPSYGLAVVLFALLVSSGLGSYSTERLAWLGSARVRLWTLLAVLAVFGLASPVVARTWSDGTNSLRVAATVAMLAPIGFFMGMAFPLGMGVALRRCPPLAPWLWGVNGAMSVCASVAALVVALSWGISASFWLGVAFYAVAAGVLPREPRPST